MRVRDNKIEDTRTQDNENHILHQNKSIIVPNYVITLSFRL